MKILVVSNEYPATSQLPGPQRLFHLARELAEKHTLVLCTFDENEKRKVAYKSDPSTTGVFKRIIHLNNRPNHSPTWLQKQHHRLAQEPYFSNRIKHPQFVKKTRESIDQAISEFKPDIIYVNAIEMFQYLPKAIPNRHTRLAVDLCDCLSSLFRKQAAVAGSSFERLLLQLEARSVAKLESQVIHTADLVSVISEADRTDLLKLVDEADILVVNAGVDVNYFNPTAVSAGDNTFRLVFSGVMSYPPNEDAAKSLVDDIAPIVRSRVSSCEFLLLGAEPSQALTAHATAQDVRVSGEVDDVRTWFKSSDTFICPLRFGTGVKGKILSAMSMRIPVVCTPLSASGIAAVDNEHLLLGDSAAELAEKAILLNEDRDLRARLIDNAYELATSNYSWSEKSRGLEQALLGLARK